MTVGERSHTGTCTGTCTGVLGDRSSRDHCLDRTTKMFQGMCRELTTNQGLPISIETEERFIYDELLFMHHHSANLGYIHIHECEYKNMQPKCCIKHFFDFAHAYTYKIFYMLNLCILVYTVCVLIIYLLNFNARSVPVIGL